jgi:uncharacterized protein (TIGR02266 family)
MIDLSTRTHFRGKQRLGSSLPLRFRPTDSEQPLELSATTDNIGPGGAFIAYRTPLPIGTALMLSLDLPHAPEPVEIAALVRWIVPFGDEHDSPGMGVEFVEPEVDIVLALETYLDSLTGTDV